VTADPPDAALQNSVDASFDLLEGDLMTLFKRVVAHNKRIADGDIRTASAILQPWLCEGRIGRLCHGWALVRPSPYSITRRSLPKSRMCQTCAPI